MANISDYLEWRGDISFREDPFNEVDNLILSELAYTRFGDIIPADGKTIPIRKAAEDFFALYPAEDLRKSTSFLDQSPLLMEGMITGKRFGNMKLCRYINEVDPDKDLQISALTFRLDDCTAYVAFRGTDSTVVGWKEDFDLSYKIYTEGQSRAVDYLNETGARLRCPIRVGGHSKGGNFAVFASAFCKDSVKRKIKEVYSNDGPGFRKEVTSTPEYKALRPHVRSYVPDTSIIGMLLSTGYDHNVVESSGKGIMQHDGFTWQVKRNRFVRADMSDFGTFVRRTQTDWLRKFDDETRESFTRSLFSIFEATGAETFGEIGDSKWKSIESMFSAMRDMPRDKQKVLLRVAGELLESGGQTAKSMLPDLDTLIQNIKEGK
jgi:hypothetical protein